MVRAPVDQRAQIFRRLLRRVNPYRGQLAAAVACALASAGAAAAYAYLVGPLAKAVLAGGSAGMLWGRPAEQALPVAIVAVALCKAVAGYFQSGWMTSAGQKVVAGLRGSLHAKVLR